MIEFSILMLCAKYQEAGLCGSREKCDADDDARRRTVIPICRLRLSGQATHKLTHPPTRITLNRNGIV